MKSYSTKLSYYNFSFKRLQVIKLSQTDTFVLHFISIFLVPKTHEYFSNLKFTPFLV